MTPISPARRPLVGSLIAIAGLLAVLAVVFAYVSLSLGGAWLGTIGDAALALAFLFLLLGRSTPVILRIVFAVAAVGWAILAISPLVSLGTIYTVGVVLALAGTLVGGILVFARRLISGLAGLLFLLATIVVAAVQLNLLLIILGGSGFITGILGFIVSPLSALLLLLAGILIALRR